MSECVEAALAAAVSKLDTSKLKKVEVIVTKPRGVPAGSVTVVAHSAAEKACSRKSEKLGGHVNSGTERSSSSSSRKEQQQQQRREQRQQQQQLERSPQPSRNEKKRHKLWCKWRVRRLVAFARIFLDGTLRRWIRTPREQRAAIWLRTLSEQRAARWTRHAAPPAAEVASAAPAAVDAAMPPPAPGQSVLGPRCASEMDSQSALGTSEGKRRTRTSRAERPSRRAENRCPTNADAIAAAIRKANPQMLRHQVQGAVYVILNDTEWAERGKYLHELTNGVMGDGGASTSDAA